MSAPASRGAEALAYLAKAELATVLPVNHWTGATAGVEPPALAVIGAGTMGSGIVLCALDAGLRVILLDQQEGALTAGLARIEQHYARRVDKGSLDVQEAHRRLGRLSTGTDWRLLGPADVVIEAVFEDVCVKCAVFASIGQHVRADTIVATNTSYLDVDLIASACVVPERVLGLHFFSPAQKMRLVEVVNASATSASTLAAGIALVRRLGKLPVVTRNAFGFIGNRIFAAYRRQCEFMVEEGAGPEQIDSVLERFGFAMGPFAVADLSGLDIAYRMRRSQAPRRDPDARYVDIPDRLCEAGRLGRKSGAGYYRYEDGKRVVDPWLRQLILEAGASRGIVRRPIDDADICHRVLITMVNEAALLFSEGVTASASDIDVVLANGYGFPRSEGGPVYWARQQDRAQLAGWLDSLAAVTGPGFVRGDLAALLSTNIL